MPSFIGRAGVDKDQLDRPRMTTSQGCEGLQRQRDVVVDDHDHAEFRSSGKIELQRVPPAEQLHGLALARNDAFAWPSVVRSHSWEAFFDRAKWRRQQRMSYVFVSIAR